MMHSMSSSLMGPSSGLYGVALLQGVEPGVEAIRGEELLVGAGLRDAAVLDHEDPVHAAHQPELVGYDEGGASLRERAPALLHGARGLGLEAGLGLVPDPARALPQPPPADGDPHTQPPRPT